MKLTARQKEIVRALREGSFLNPPYGHSSRTWELRNLSSRFISEKISPWIKNDTIQGMKECGMLTRELDSEGFHYRLVPTVEALQAIAK